MVAKLHTINTIRGFVTHLEHGDALLEGDAQRRPQILDGLHGELLRNKHQLVREAVADAVKDEGEQLAHHLQEHNS